MVIKRNKTQTMINKIRNKETKYCTTETKLKTGGGLGSPRKIRSSYITSDICSGIVSMTNVISGPNTQRLIKSWRRRKNFCKSDDFHLTCRNSCLVAALLAATLCQEYHARNKFWNIVPIGRYICQKQVMLECCYE